MERIEDPKLREGQTRSEPEVIVVGTRENKPVVLMNVRESVAQFAMDLELQLRRNDHKQSWRTMSPLYHLGRMQQEFEELQAAVRQRDPGGVIHEALDVAAFAMFVVDTLKLGSPLR